MGARTSGREAALQMLFGLDAAAPSDDGIGRAIHDYWRELPGDVEGREYADELVRGVMASREAVELAKRYGAEGSSVFVNGVLDRIAEDLGR